tara:strand:+ start:468 stop:686 length:219 start_codon:yes stop_codon:yes gene_type:complete
VGEGDLSAFLDAHDLFLRLVLAQQLQDIGQGKAPGSKVDIAALDRPTRKRLRKVLRSVSHLPQLALDVAACG